MDLNKLTAISPVDGRYRSKVDLLGNYFSEYALIKYRVKIEVEYFIALCKLGISGLKWDFRSSYGGSSEACERVFSQGCRAG